MNLTLLANKYRWLLWVLITALTVFAAVIAVDFGQQADETVLLKKLSDSVSYGLLITDWHFYPTFYYYLTAVCLMPEIIRHRRIFAGDLLSEQVSTFMKQLGEFARSKTLLLRARVVFICVSALALLWCFLLLYAWRRNTIEALLGTALLGFCTEAINHMRWLAPDTLVMQWTTATMLFLFLATQPKHGESCLKLAAVCAGLACGTKYTAGALLIPIGLAVWFFPFGNFKNRVKLALVALLLFGLTYYLTTPGTLLNPLRFAYCIREQKRVYYSGFLNYSVQNPWSHFLLNIEYFALAVFSKFRVISLFVFLMATAGLVALVREIKNRYIWVFLSYPTFHLFLMSTSKVFFVRNLIVLVPFYAILAARGICWLFSGTRHAFVKIVFSTTTAALIIFNVFVIVGDALEVRHQNSVDYLKRTLDYINRHPSQVFLLSPLIQKQASVKHEKIPSNTRSLPDATEINSAVFYYSEIEGSSALEVGKLDQTKWFGPPFVNYNYYPTWPNTIRIMIMPIREAKKFNLFHAAEARS